VEDPEELVKLFCDETRCLCSIRGGGKDKTATYGIARDDDPGVAPPARKLACTLTHPARASTPSVLLSL